MSGLPNFIKDLSLILGAAAVFTVICKRLKLPLVLGYIIAGILVSRNFDYFPTITDYEGVKIWADIGVIFLLFALGLEFSFKKLIKVGPSAAVTGLYEVGFMFLLGFSAGKLMNWTFMDSLFLGGIISISSTTIIYRALDEMGLKTRQFTRLVFGVLVIEDLMAVLLMVLLTTFSVSRTLQGTEMLYSVARLVFFLAIWFFSGIFIIPSLFKLIAKYVNNEMLLVISLALCLLMVVLADTAGFSAALGAFVMGSILSETLHSERIEKLVKSIKHLFGAIFFVSVGLMADISILQNHWLPVISLTLLVIVGKTFFVATGALLSGKALRQSVQAGTAMSQIGEFSFIIAALGTSLKVTSGFIYPIAVGVSVLSVFLTPFMIRLAEPLLDVLNKHLPAKWLNAINNYSTSSGTLKTETEWQKVIKDFTWILIGNGVFMGGIIWISLKIIAPWLHELVNNQLISNILIAVSSLTLMAPFIWALTGKRITSTSYKSLWLQSRYNRGPLVVLEILRNALAVILVGVLLSFLFSWKVTLIGTVAVMFIILIIFNNRLNKFYHRIESRFIKNLNEKEKSASLDHLSPWDAHLVNYELPGNFADAGIPLGKLAWREKYGINIAFIERAGKIVIAPTKDDILFPHDVIGVIGTDAQLNAFSSLIEHKPDLTIHDEKDNIELMQISVNEHTRLKGQTIVQSGIREKINGIIVGIERDDQRILNPPSSTVFQWGDVVWMVGDKRKIKLIYKD